MEQTEQAIQMIEEGIRQLTFHAKIATKLGSEQQVIDLHGEAIQTIVEVKEILSTAEIAFNYISQFQNQMTQLLNLFPYRHVTDNNFWETIDTNHARRAIQASEDSVRSTLSEIRFSITFFSKLGFFKNNVVAVGANGSGKTSLSNDLKRHLSQNGVVISAQKVLVIPTFGGISNINSTSQKLQGTQTADKTYKTTYSTENGGNAYSILVQMGSEFHILLDNLLAERSAVRNKYCDDQMHNRIYKEVPETKLDKTLAIWNSLLTHRTISCLDGINITLKPSVGSEYPAYQMSDGEKVLLFLVAQVLQAPANGFIVVDEPEMYLHKTIVGKLWDKLEAERDDCIFIYLTHDLDFAASRTDAKKIWIRSFEYPATWQIEEIPDNELPEQLLLELLGSRKDILFCEGKSKSLDTKIFSLLFDEYTVCSVDSCFDVIYYTKAFNKIRGINIKAFGIIDSDHHTSDRLTRLEQDNVYSFAIAEIENLLLDETFLKAVAAQLLVNQAVVDAVKSEIINHLRLNIESQVAEFVSTKINYYFHDSHVSSGKNTAAVSTNLKKFIDGVKISEWADARTKEIEEIIQKGDYVRTLQVFNNKGLKAVVQKHLKTCEFTELSLRLLNERKDARDILRMHFPQTLRR